MFRSEKTCLVVTLVGIALFVTGCLLLKNSASFNNSSDLGSGSSDTPATVGIILLLVGILVAVWPWVSRFNNWWIGNLRTATTPLPSPAEIHQTLSNYYGREATLEEVAAAQSLFTHQRNEAAAQAALGVGAFLLFTGRL